MGEESKIVLLKIVVVRQLAIISWLPALSDFRQQSQSRLLEVDVYF